MAGGEPVDVVENAQSGDGGCPANAFLGGLEDELHLAAEGLLVVGEPLRDAKAHGRVAVVPAGVGEAGTRGGEALAVGQMVFVLRLLDGEAVDVEAKRGDGTGTARVEHADAARVAAHALEEGFGDACGAGELNGGLDLFGLAAHDGVGIDHLKAGEDLEAERLEAIDEVGRRFEFEPAFFRIHVEAAAVLDHAVNVLFGMCGHVDVFETPVHADNKTQSVLTPVDFRRHMLKN